MIARLFETADSAEINYRKSLRDAMLRAVGSSRFALYHHVLRRAVEPTVGGTFPDRFSGELDEVWRDRLASKQLFSNDLFLCLIRRPLQGRGGMAESLLRLFGRASAGSRDAELADDWRALDAAKEALLAALAPYEARSLRSYRGAAGTCSEALEYLFALYNGEVRPVQLPEGMSASTFPRGASASAPRRSRWPPLASRCATSSASSRSRTIRR